MSVHKHSKLTANKHTFVHLQFISKAKQVLTQQEETV